MTASSGASGKAQASAPSDPTVEPPRTQDAPVVCMYGELGTGKTVDEVYSWAGRGLFIAQPGAMRVGENVAGFDVSPYTVQCSTMQQAIAWIPYARDNGFQAVVLDDCSFFMRNTVAAAKPIFAIKEKVNGQEVVKGYDFGMYSYFRTVMSELAYTARWAGVVVVTSWHEQPAFTEPKTGERYLIGPDTGWNKLVKEIPGIVDTVLRTRKRGPNVPEWDTRADCDNSASDAYMKDRFDRAIPRDGPLNTAEIVRAAGFPLSRPAGFEWQEEIAEDICQRILAGQPEKDARKAWVDFLAARGSEHHPLHVRWALRDGSHRGRIRMRSTKNVLSAMT